MERLTGLLPDCQHNCCLAAALPDLCYSSCPRVLGWGEMALEGGLPADVLMSYLFCLITLVMEAFLQLCQKGLSCSCVLPVTLWVQTW